MHYGKGAALGNGPTDATREYRNYEQIQIQVSTRPRCLFVAVIIITISLNAFCAVAVIINLRSLP